MSEEIKSIRSTGITVVDDKTKARMVFQEKILELPERFRFLYRLAVHTFDLPNGGHGRWESGHSNEAGVLVAALTPEKKLILVTLFRFPLHCDCVELPGGNARPGESAGDAARRKLLEETGYSTKQSLIGLGGGPLASGVTNVRYTIIAALDCRKTVAPKPDPVEQFTGLRVGTVNPKIILRAMTKGGNPNVDPQLAHALLALLAKGIIRL